VGSAKCARAFDLEKGMMIRDPAIIRQAMADTVTDGVENVPTRLLALLEAESDSLATLGDSEKVGSFYEAVRADVGFLDNLGTGREIDADQTAKLTAAFRWLLRQTATWSAAADPKRATLLAIFVMAQYADFGGVPWGSAPGQARASAEILDFVAGLFGKSGIAYATRGGLPPPIWEGEAVVEIQVADAAGDWEGLENLAGKFRDSVFPGLIPSQATQILNRFAPNRLVEATAGVRQVILAMQILRSLGPQDQLWLGAASDNPHMQFAAVYETITPWINRELPPVEKQSLTALFLKVAQEPVRYSAWMRAFNRYPGRYRPIQEALGEALAWAPDTAIASYIDALVLSPHPENHQSPVDVALRAFHAAAPLARRQLLWRTAHDKWRRWAFEEGFPERHIFAVQRSDLDYAVVGYSVECATQDVAEQATNQILLGMRQIENLWYQSITTHQTDCNRQLSLLQPLAHALHVRLNGGDWYREGRQYQPFVPGTNLYLERMRGMQNSSGRKGGPV
jgi:hypothetical protein